jgi:hypothetical protein
MKTQYRVAGEAVSGREPLKVPVIEPGDSIRLGTDPNVLPIVRQQRRHGIAGEVRSVSLVVDIEAHAVEARESFFGSQPYVALGSLRYSKDRALRKPAFCLPGLMNILGQRLCRIKARLCRAWSERQ